MRKITLLVLFVFLFGYGLQSQSYGYLSVETTTSHAGGNYKPKNVVAIWVEDNSGNFIKTLLAYGNNRKTHLNNWESSTTGAGSAFNTVDAISGATRSSHATRNCIWNGQDFNGNLVADGTYKLCMELTDKNSTGNYSTFSFVKGPNADNQTPPNKPSFAAISLNWKPSAVDISEAKVESKIKVYPNPTKDQITIEVDHIQYIEMYSVSGKLIYQGSDKVIDLSTQENGIYIVKVTTKDDVFVEKVFKQ